MNSKRLLAFKNKIWLWAAVDHFRPGILALVLGRRDARTFEPLWQRVKTWQSYFYVTDGWRVYPCLIEAVAHIVSKTYMTRGRREYTTTTLSGKTATQNVVLFQVSSNAEILGLIATLLFAIPLHPQVQLIHL